MNERSAMRDRLEIAEAQLCALYNALALLVDYVQRTGGYMAPEDQKTLRDAIATLDEVSR
jgi:hypothetical protein